MFKNISTIILTVLCLLSCSEAKDDIPSQNPDVPPTPDANMISFSSSDSNWQEGETNTRATELETLYKDFIVYGFLKLILYYIYGNFSRRIKSI